VVGFFSRSIVQMAFESLGVLSFGLRLDFGRIGEDFAVELVPVGDGFLKRQSMLGRVEVVELCLGLVAQKAGELGEGDGFF
jgi:hypothetical protein